jgi:hypothetical protein
MQRHKFLGEAAEAPEITIKEKLPVSGIRHVVVTCRRGTSVVRNLKFLTLPHFEQNQSNNNHHTIYEP